MNKIFNLLFFIIRITIDGKVADIVAKRYIDRNGIAKHTIDVIELNVS